MTRIIKRNSEVNQLDYEYRQTMQKNELILRDGEVSEEAEFLIRMAVHNRIPGVLSFSVEQTESGRQYRYDIGTRQTLVQRFNTCAMSYIQLEALIRDIVGIVEGGREYLIEETEYVLDPEHIYFAEDSGQVYLCCYPGLQRGFRQQLAGLFEYLLSHIDYKDSEAVEAAYGLYMKSRVAGCGFASLLAVFDRHDEADASMLTEAEKKTVQCKEVRMETTIPYRELQAEGEPEEQEPARDDSGYQLQAEQHRESIKISGFPCYISQKNGCAGEALNEPVLGETQARISMRNETVYIEDMKSENGTFVNGRRIAGNEIHKLNIGDRVMLADRSYRFMKTG